MKKLRHVQLIYFELLVLWIAWIVSIVLLLHDPLQASGTFTVIGTGIIGVWTIFTFIVISKKRKKN